jgi:hypothetical protein
VDFVAVMDEVIALLRQRGRLTYRTLQRQFQLDEVALEDLKEELIYGQRLAVDEDGRVLVWTGATGPTVPAATAPTETAAPPPLTYTPPYLAEKILTTKSALEGERKQVTVLFADLKGSMELLADRDPEEARQLLDPVLERLMAAVHRYEGTVNQIMGDGIMALFGAPVAHEDHAVRACYAALAMQEAIRRYSAEVRRTHGVEVQIRVGLNSGEVAADRVRGPATGPGAGRGRARAGGGHRRRSRRREIAPRLRSYPLPPHPGLAGAGKCLGVLR